MATLLYRLGHLCARHRRATLAIWLVVLVGVAVGSQVASGETVDRLAIPGTESQDAGDLLTERFPAQSGSSMRIVFEAPPGERLRDPVILAGITNGLRDVVTRPGVVTPTGPEGFVFEAPDERIAFAEVRFLQSAEEVDGALVDQIESAARASVSPEVKITFSGAVVAANEAAEPPSSEAIGLGVAVIVLLFAFGSVIAMGLPLLTALIGVGIGITGISLASAFIDFSSVAPTLATMIGLAVGIDYALFIVTRHRQFLADGLDVEEAAARATATAGGAVVFAGLTVVIAISGLAVVGIPFLTAMGLAAAATVLIAVAIAVTLLPALLGFAGHVIDRFKVPGMKAVTGESEDHSETFSGRFAGEVTGHPTAFLVVGVVVMAVLAIPLLSMRLGLPDDGTKAEDSTERQAYDTLVRGFGPGFNAPLTLVVDLAGVPDATGALAEISAAVKADPAVVSVSPATPNQAGDTAVVTAIPRTSPSDERTSDLVHRLRDEVIPPVAKATGAQVFVTGSTASNIDISDKLSTALPIFMVLVIGLTFILLMIVFRSLLVPLKAAIAILLSIASSFGVLVAVFQWGWAKDFIGLDTTVPIISFLPLMMFAILFGLSMDYEVFILARIREEYSRSGDARGSVLKGLSSSARVITAAALIMISVFAAFVLGGDPTIKMFGVGLATAVFLDATVVRMMIVPAVMALFGDRAWWLPGWLDRLLPNLDVEGEHLLTTLAEVEREGPS